MKRYSSVLPIIILTCAFVGATLPAGAVISAPPSAGLVGWWRGEGDAMDSSGNGHNGSLQSSIGFTSGISGQAFATSGGSVLIPDSPAFQLTSSLTIGAWVNMSAPSFNVLWRGDARAGFDPWGISGDGAGNMGFQICNATPANEVLQTGIPLNQWVQVTGTLDGSTGDMRLYINGALASQVFTAIRPFGPLDPAQNPGVGIGNVPAGGNFPFIGAIDEVVLYNRALSPGEVMALVPEPGSLTLLGCGLAGFLWKKSRSARRTA